MRIQILMALCSFCGYMLMQSKPQLNDFTIPEPSAVFEIQSDILQVMQDSQAEIEANPQLGASANDLQQSIAALSRQIGQMHAGMLSEDKVNMMVDEKISAGKFVSYSILQDTVAEVKEDIQKVQAAAKLSSDGGCNCEAKLTEIFQRLEALEAKCGLAALSSSAPVQQSYYPSVSSSQVANSGGSNGSLQSRSYQPAVSYQAVQSAPMQVSYPQQVVQMPSVQYSVSNQPVVQYSTEQPMVEAPEYSYAPVASTVRLSDGGGGCTGSVLRTSQPAVMSYAVQSAPVMATPVQSLSVAPRTREVRIVEPREPRRVSVAQVPDAQTSFSVQTSVPSVSSNGQCYVDENGNQVCPNTSSAAPVSPLRSTRGIGGADGRLATPFR